MKYLQRSYYGLTAFGVRILAFEYASKLKLQMPLSWTDFSTAGIDWFRGFMKRHQNLSLRKPQATSLAASIIFNRCNVELLFENVCSSSESGEDSSSESEEDSSSDEN